MSQYFHFYNLNTGEINDMPIETDEPLVTWVDKLNYMSRTDILDFFNVISINKGWLCDDIIACGDGERRHHYV